MTIEMFLPVHMAWYDAAARIASAILLSLGIGADIVKGAGSAASIWSAGAIGLICGMGLIWSGGAIALGICALLLLSRLYVDTDAYTVAVSKDVDADSK